MTNRPGADIEVASTRLVDETDAEIDVTITVEIAHAAGHLVGKCDGRCDILEAAVVLPIQPIRTTPTPTNSSSSPSSSKSVQALAGRR